MRHLRGIFMLLSCVLVTSFALGLSSCAPEVDGVPPGTYRSAITGEDCEPDPDSFVPLYPEGTTFEDGKPWKPEKRSHRLPLGWQQRPRR